MAAIGRDVFPRKPSRRRPGAVRATKFVEHFLPDETGGAGDESGSMSPEFQRRVAKLETARKPRPSSIVIMCGSFDAFADAAYTEVMAGALAGTSCESSITSASGTRAVYGRSRMPADFAAIPRAK